MSGIPATSNAKPKVLLIGNVLLSLLDLPEGTYDIRCLDDLPGDAVIDDARILASWGMAQIGPALLARLPALEAIVSMGAGYDGIDIAAARAAGVAVATCGAVNADDVADHAITMLLAHRREVVANDAWVKQDEWPKAWRPFGRSIANEKVGIVGLGAIGQAVAARLEPFSCAIAWWGPRPKPEARWPRCETLDALCGWADTLILATPGDASTRGLIGEAQIAALGPDGLIVNVARGSVLNEAAVIAALRAGRLGGAALDVFETEPFAGSAYADVPNLLLSPHTAGATLKARDDSRAITQDNIARFFAGAELTNRVA